MPWNFFLSESFTHELSPRHIYSSKAPWTHNLIEKKLNSEFNVTHNTLFM